MYANSGARAATFFALQRRLSVEQCRADAALLLSDANHAFAHAVDSPKEKTAQKKKR